MVNIIYENEKEIRKIMKWYNNDIPRIDFWVNIDKLITDVKVSRVELPVKPEIANLLDSMIRSRETLFFENADTEESRNLQLIANIEINLLKLIKERI